MTATDFLFSKWESLFSKKKVQTKVQKLLDKLRTAFCFLYYSYFRKILTNLDRALTCYKNKNFEFFVTEKISEKDYYQNF